MTRFARQPSPTAWMRRARKQTAITLLWLALGACHGEGADTHGGAAPVTAAAVPDGADVLPPGGPSLPAETPPGPSGNAGVGGDDANIAPVPVASQPVSPPATTPPDLDAGTPDAGTDAGAAASDDDRCGVAVAEPARPPAVFDLSGNLGTHDPTLIEREGTFYILQTGAGNGTRLPGKISTDLRAMDGNFGALGSQNPAWIASQVPQASNLWAPDLSFFGGVYHLYYSASSFGSNTSCIGHATCAQIGAEPFSDAGSVLCSKSGDDYNAIDPNVVVDGQGTPWLFFGSFWDGIRAAKLTTAGARADDQLHRIASRGGGAIEAPVVVRRCGYYYLFVSFDSCCQGASSTYNIRVGRSAEVLGPYLDRAGVDMLDGGGTRLVEGDATFAAAGHNAVLFSGAAAYNVYHAYRRSTGQPELRIAELVWDVDGWPLSGGP